MNGFVMMVMPRLIGADAVSAVHGRELRGSLAGDTPFRDWIARRTATHVFREREDFHAELSKESAISLGSR